MGSVKVSNSQVFRVLGFIKFEGIVPMMTEYLVDYQYLVTSYKFADQLYISKIDLSTGQIIETVPFLRQLYMLGQPVRADVNDQLEKQYELVLMRVIEGRGNQEIPPAEKLLTRFVQNFFNYQLKDNLFFQDFKRYGVSVEDKFVMSRNHLGGRMIKLKDQSQNVEVPMNQFLAAIGSSNPMRELINLYNQRLSESRHFHTSKRPSPNHKKGEKLLNMMENQTVHTLMGSERDDVSIPGVLQTAARIEGKTNDSLDNPNDLTPIDQ